MNCEKVSECIINWLIKQVEESHLKGFVVGVSGGVDSGLVSTLCAKTGKPTLCLSMPIYQDQNQVDRAIDHMGWLRKFDNVTTGTIDLTETFKKFVDNIKDITITELAQANIRSRLRMVTLYSYSNTMDYLVAGTGNKIEDMGVMFFTKHGDGGVDLSPIGDLLKSEVRELACYLGVSRTIYEAVPTDGLWGDNRSDEIQIGATYDELEFALNAFENEISASMMTPRQVEVYNIFVNRHEKGSHKMCMPPICTVPNEIKEW